MDVSNCYQWLYYFLIEVVMLSSMYAFQILLLWMYRPLSLFFAFVRSKGGDINAIVLLEKKGKKRKGMKQVYVKKALFLLFDVMQELEYGFFFFFFFCVGKV